MRLGDFGTHPNFVKSSFQSNSLDPDKDRRSVNPDLGPYCLQRLSVYKKVAAPKLRVKLV